MSLSPTAGADRVAARCKTEQAARLEAYEQGKAPLYACEGCGGDEFIVERTCHLSLQVSHGCPCTCSNALEWAAIADTQRIEEATDVGILDEEHRVVDWDPLDTGEVLVNEGYPAISIECPSCNAECGPEDWESLDDEPEGEVIEEDFLVKCGNCDREIEFGWSHSEQGGRIWPVEAADFNPWMSFPDTKYTEDWRRRGWLRPLAATQQEVTRA